MLIKDKILFVNRIVQFVKVHLLRGAGDSTVATYMFYSRVKLNRLVELCPENSTEIE